MESSHHDFFAQYKAISSKLRKRFLRKPNIAEASIQFSALAKELENQECPHYAAFCCLAVARCEHSLGNAIFDSQNLLHAARLFLEAEKVNHQLLCPAYSEHLQAAVAAYCDCIKVHLDNEQFALAAALYLELGEALRQLGRVAEAIPHFLKAAKLHRHCVLDYINDLTLVGECRLLTGDLDGALSALTEIQVLSEKRGKKENDERIGVYASILRETEISRILLLILLQPPDFKMKPEHARLLEEYADIYSEPPDYIEEDLYFLLQSLMIAVRNKDRTSLKELEKDVWPYLNGQQIDILSKIICKLRNNEY